MFDFLRSPGSVAHQAPLSMGFSRRRYWSRLPFPFPGGGPDSRMEPESPALQLDSILLSYQGSPTGIHISLKKLDLQCSYPKIAYSVN